MFNAPPARCRAVTIPVCPPSMPRARAPGAPVAWHELERSLVLRMDDPGGAQNVYLRGWTYPKLTESEWGALGADLRRRNGRLSVCYVSGWVDDGDAARGTLEVGGRP